jgi:hypothetical protein
MSVPVVLPADPYTHIGAPPPKHADPKSVPKKEPTSPQSTKFPVAQVDCSIDDLTPNQRDMLSAYIYRYMEAKFPNQEGYLIVDVLADVRKLMGDETPAARLHIKRFTALLRTYPQYFNVFRVGMKFNEGRPFAGEMKIYQRKCAEMVSIAPNKAISDLRD